eukprot:scaffold124597_cov45-Phaeocystis_antarctica.AAC.1
MAWAPPSVEAALKGKKRAAEDQAAREPAAKAAKAEPKAAAKPAAAAAKPAAAAAAKPAAPAAAANAPFVAAKKFGGKKAGYVFKKGAQGVGYYADVKPVPTIGKKGAAAGAAGAAAAKPATRKLPNGVEVTDLTVGKGKQADRGLKVNVKYAGTLTNGKRFDAGKIAFRLGGGEVIKGWDVGVAGMKVGGKRQLRIPPDMAYGRRGAPPDIPANATLLFDVELLGC